MFDPMSFFNMFASDPAAAASYAAEAGVPPPPVPQTDPFDFGNTMASGDPNAIAPGVQVVDPNQPSPFEMVGTPEFKSTGMAPADGISQTSLDGKTMAPTMADRLAGAMKGVKAPPAPEGVKVSTPAPTRALAAGGKGTDLLALMQMLGIGGPQGGVASGLKLPPTLGQALGGR